MLAPEKYIDVIEHTQLVSIDLLLVSTGDTSDEKILLGKRVNQPARGTWFVPGSRLYKEETIQEGVRRVSRDELGVEINVASLVGVFDHIYDTNFLEKQALDNRQQISTHYVALGMLVHVNNETMMKINASSAALDQHGEMQWMSFAEALARDEVHAFTKNYVALLLQKESTSIPFGDARNFKL